MEIAAIGDRYPQVSQGSTQPIDRCFRGRAELRHASQAISVWLVMIFEIKPY